MGSLLILTHPVSTFGAIFLSRMVNIHTFSPQYLLLNKLRQIECHNVNVEEEYIICAWTKLRNKMSKGI